MPERVRNSECEQNPSRPLAGVVRGETKSDARIIVRIERRGVKILDTDNLYGSVKFILDGLRIAKLIPGDDPSAIDLTVSQTRVASFKEIETIVEIDYGPV